MKKLTRRLRRWLHRERLASSPFYERFPPKLPVGSLDLRTAVSREHRFILFRVPKSANSTVVSTLHFAATGQEITSRRELERLKLEHFDRASSLSEEEVGDLEAGYFKFTFVRHPVPRILSCYRDKIVNHRDTPAWRKYARLAGVPDGAEVSFSAFLESLRDERVMRADPHWARQVDLLTIPPGSLDLVGHVESLEADLGAACRAIFGRDVPLQSFQEHATGAASSSRELEDEDLRRVRELYAADFAALGYE